MILKGYITDLFVQKIETKHELHSLLEWHAKWLISECHLIPAPMHVSKCKTFQQLGVLVLHLATNYDVA